MTAFAEPKAITAHLRAVVPTKRFTVEQYDELEPSSAEWLVKNLLPASGVGFLVGPSMSRKSFLALEWSLRLAGGDAILDHRAAKAGVVYVASEGASGVRKRVAAWRKHRDQADRRVRAFDLIGQAPDLTSRAEIEDLVQVIQDAAHVMTVSGRAKRLGLVVIDTLAASMPGADENSGADMSAVLSNLQWLGQETDTFVLIVAHTGKDEGRGLRGWSGQFAAADVVFSITRDEESGLSQGVIKKQKDGEDGEKFAFRLEGVPLGYDADGDEIGSAVVVYEPVPDGPAARTRKPTAHSQKVMSAFARLLDEGCDHPAPNAPGVKPGTRAVTMADLKAKAFDLGLAAGTDPGEDASATERTRYRDGRNKAFQRGLEGLETAKALRSENGFVWEPR